MMKGPLQMTPFLKAFPYDNRNYTGNVLQSQDYMTHLSRLYAMAEAATHDGLARGVTPKAALSGVCTYTFCQRGQVDLLDAWNVVRDAWSVARIKGGAA